MRNAVLFACGVLSLGFVAVGCGEFSENTHAEISVQESSHQDAIQFIRTEAWGCGVEHFNTRDGCDCGCGELDPDCLWKTQAVGCPASTPACSVRGECVSASSPGAITPR